MASAKILNHSDPKATRAFAVDPLNTHMSASLVELMTIEFGAGVLLG